ncbi:DUF2294 domain-containing protein [Bacillus sp. Y1]|nr:DUF2294 domain-containing protein [Bacillus sp. Y1]AYA78371.1 DUF2294 domain-containing protein [Bacillus sp. Y1]
MKRTIEDRISKMVTQWEKEYLGRGPLSVKSDIVRNMVVVVLRGILTPAEKELAKTQDGLLSIKKIRADLVETGSKQLKAMIKDIVKSEVISFHTDISTKSGERLIVFILEKNLEETLQMVDN